jgi:hypothetical protein
MGEEAMMSASVIFLKLVTHAERNGSWSLHYGTSVEIVYLAQEI